MPGIFVQASAIELAHIAERSRKSQSKFSCKRAQSRTIALSQMSKIEFTRILPWRAIALLRTCSGYAECSRKSRRSGSTPQDIQITPLIELVRLVRPNRSPFFSLKMIRVDFFDIFGCARHNSNKFGFALACTKISEIRGQKTSRTINNSWKRGRCAWNFRASERRAELVRAMPSAAENLEEVAVRHRTYK